MIGWIRSNVRLCSLVSVSVWITAVAAFLTNDKAHLCCFIASNNTTVDLPILGFPPALSWKVTQFSEDTKVYSMSFFPHLMFGVFLLHLSALKYNTYVFSLPPWTNCDCPALLSSLRLSDCWPFCLICYYMHSGVHLSLYARGLRRCGAFPSVSPHPLSSLVFPSQNKGRLLMTWV